MKKIYSALVKVSLSILLVSVTQISFAQQDTVSTDDLLMMSFADLMDVQIESASKKKESLFDAPLSTTVLTAMGIENSGATSIPELLRLVPGLIVREKTNGNYDVHIRGNDNIQSGVVNSTNTKTLVMIDNRIVYNYFQGGTFWETLPISVDDIEKIELIRGPASALFGPNAVTGVINIITKKAEGNNKVSTTVYIIKG